MRQNRLDLPYTGQNESLGPIGIMHIARSMPDIPYLAGLGDGTKQRVVAALSFLLFVETHSRAFGKAAGRQYRAVKVQRDAGKPHISDLVQHPVPAEPAQLVHTLTVHTCQGTADSRHIRQTLKSQQVAHHGIALVIAHILEPAISQKKMNDQQHDNNTVAIDRADGKVTETHGQVLLQANMTEQRLKHHQSGERGQSLILKPDLGNTMGFTMNGGFATLHGNGLFWLICWIGLHQFYQARGRFLLSVTTLSHQYSMLSGLHQG